MSPADATPTATDAATDGTATVTRPHVKCVVAYSRNRVIGKENALPWHLPADLQHFKRNTMGQPIIMGRKTWDSLGRPLPGRRNIVISRDPQKTVVGAEVFCSLDQALQACHNEAVVCIIGGAQIFNEALPLIEELIATEVHADIEGDVFFPELDGQQWQEISRHPQAVENGYAYDFVTYRRVKDSVG